MKPSERLRLTGRLLLVCGVVAAILFYWVQSRNAAPAIDELAAGYLKARDHELGQLMGPIGVTMTQWMDMLQQPITEAALIVLSSAAAAWVCFRLSESADEPDA
jgi:hypothetical protein